MLVKDAPTQVLVALIQRYELWALGSSRGPSGAVNIRLCKQAAAEFREELEQRGLGHLAPNYARE